MVETPQDKYQFELQISYWNKKKSLKRYKSGTLLMWCGNGTPVNRTGDPGSNPDPCKKFSL